MRAKITKRVVDAALIETGRLYVYDIEIKGFGLLVTPSGHKSYFVEYRPKGRGRNAPKRRYTIGTHGSPWTPEMARKDALRVLEDVSHDKDPAAGRALAKQVPWTTFKDVTLEYVEKYAKPKQKSWRETERVFKRDILPKWGNKRLEDITRSDVVALMDGISSRAPIMANRVLAYLKKFFNWCCERGYIGTSPCFGLKPPGREHSRDRVLNDDELASVWKASDTVGWPWGPLVKLLILTAQRRNEVAGMRWDELDLEKKTWSLPQGRAKNKNAHVIPLVQTAIDILKEFPPTGEFVFTTTGRTPVSGFSKAKKVLNETIKAALYGVTDDAPINSTDHEKNEMSGWTFHDLRRTATTGLARLGVAPHIADAILNHKSGTISGVAAVYNRHSYIDERRDGLARWERHILDVVSEQK
ncbi:MAG TPA: integrase [Planctomycetaceae bacterium]|nr:integrase [Planctomycetaceae bacterium]